MSLKKTSQKFVKILDQVKAEKIADGYEEGVVNRIIDRQITETIEGKTVDQVVEILQGLQKSGFGHYRTGITTEDGEEVRKIIGIMGTELDSGTFVALFIPSTLSNLKIFAEMPENN
jgi:hypothetical protein